MVDNVSTSTQEESSDDVSDYLPLQLIKADAIPPASGSSESAIDWLPEFAGYSWIAYGAASLLVVSHFPNPLRQNETQIGPIFRQVFELSVYGSGSVSAVSWSPATPSAGDVAAAIDNCIGLFSHNSDFPKCYFSWSMSCILVQSSKVEAIRWTGSGDGIVTGGIDVVLWRKKGSSWGVVWKFRPELPQTLVSATWSIEGLSATAPDIQHIHGSLSLINDTSKCVLVCCSDGRFGYIKTELRHPLPVSMIQWRPTAGKESNNEALHPLRQVLLTCCVDGTVRLWSETDDGRSRKIGKEVNDRNTTKLCFRVAAVIEINQELNGSLGSDIFVRWAVEKEDMLTAAGYDTDQYFSSEECQHDKTGRCEWLVAFGPQMMVTFWAVHCLDDVTPLRFPRATLWKRQELMGYRAGNSSFLLDKVVILRNHVFSPPGICSLVRPLPCNSLSWLQLCTQAPSGIEDESSNKENLFSCAGGLLNIDGHKGKILQVALHPCGYTFDIAASLDTEGLLLFWSIFTVSNSVIGIPVLNPAWKLLGKTVIQESHLNYTCLRWANTVLDGDRVLFAGHAGGVDCFIIDIAEGEEKKILCHKLCTIPFISCGRGEGPTSIFSFPLPSTCRKTLVSNSFLLLALWKDDFQAISWNITFHPCDLRGRCSGCCFDLKDSNGSGILISESTFDGKRYCINVEPLSSVFPEPHNHDHVTGYAVVCPSTFLTREEQTLILDNGKCPYYSAYHMVTGLANGTLKLWRSTPAKESNFVSSWDLVGILAAHQGPITAISVTGCGRKISTYCPAGQSNTSNALHIWESAHVAGVGSFILEDILFLDGKVIALNWLTMGNGQLVLGVCMQHELHVYVERRCVGQNMVKSGKSFERNIWFCIAIGHTCPPIRDFLWGPKATAVIVHDDYFCLFNELLFLPDTKHKAEWHSLSYIGCLNCNGLSNKNMISAVFSDADVKETSVEDNGKRCMLKSLARMNRKPDVSSRIVMTSFKEKCNSDKKLGFWSILDVAERVGGSLPDYHPEALMLNICSGNWKRAYMALRHLNAFLTSTNDSNEKSCSTNSSHVIPPIIFSKYLEGLTTTSSSNKTFQWSENASNDSFTSFPVKAELSGFVEPLEKLYDLASISKIEKKQMFAIIDLLCEIIDKYSAYESLDEPGRRFWIAVRFQQLYYVRRFGRFPSREDLHVDSGMIAWAFHSDCQETLFQSLLPNESSWQDMRKMGVGFWYTNTTQLRPKMEKLARQQFLKDRDPKACALLYIALNRIQVLAGLFKISKDDKDKPLVGFLSRDFKEDKNKAAALKNAYVLLGRHQLELAVAFFLLGGDSTSAINVCAKNLGDEQLALVICRLLEGYCGPLESHLVSKLLLPSVIESGDFWSASYLECLLGNHLEAFTHMLGVQMDTNKSVLLANHASFLDPSIGQYCLMLATKNSMKTALGEHKAAIFKRWSILMSATALNRCGLPLEAMMCLSSSLGTFSGSDQGSISDNENVEHIFKILRPSPDYLSSNWISGDVGFQLETHAKLDLAMKYISKLLRQHPSWPCTSIKSDGAFTLSGSETHPETMLLEDFLHEMVTVLAYFEQKFSLVPFDLINKILTFLCNNGFAFIGFQILQHYISKDPSVDRKNVFGGFFDCILPKLLLKTTEEISYLFSRYIIYCSITCPGLESYSTEACMAGENKFGRFTFWIVHWQDLMQSFWSLRASLKLFNGSYGDGVISLPFLILDLCEYYVYFSSCWLLRNHEGLIVTVKPLLIATNKHASYRTNTSDLNKLLPQVSELLFRSLLINDVGDAVHVSAPIQLEPHRDIKHSSPEGDRWQIIGASMWGHMSKFLKHQLDSLPQKLEPSYSLRPLSALLPSMPVSNSYEPDGNFHAEISLVSLVLSTFLKTTFTHISSHSATQFASFMLQKVVHGSSAPTLLWLEEFSRTQSTDDHKNSTCDIDGLDMLKNENGLSESEILWTIFGNLKFISGVLSQDKLRWSDYTRLQHYNGWSHASKSIMREHETEERGNQEGVKGSSFAGKETSSYDQFFSKDVVKDSSFTKKVMPFHAPKEICKRNGELFEAMCLNSINQQEAALASNKKGIIFFSWKDGGRSRDMSEYIWAEADWPRNGWPGCESTPVRTYLSDEVGLGSKKGAHFGLGGATIGVGSLARPKRDLTGGGTSVVHGYAGIGAAGLGWGIQEDSEEVFDPPANVENVNSRALSAHPSRPFFLVGSSNTHIYLWEFAKDKATATYGVLPAANVSPPFPLASISRVQFNYSGHRFATSASDGSICTWQLDVGGRSNVHPTESSLCFNSYASDVIYATGCGSIIAAAGYSSNDLNVVIWDTLAPPRTSQASMMCHEGGARSLSVFDNDLGSGSISPFILTGGKGGDIGLHDLRYIATGRTRKHRLSDNSDQNINASTAYSKSKVGVQNANGMIWYIPKAHSGGVTKIATIPRTSFFLTGGKDGDVKLWDAKSANLVHQWPKLHERHMFLQPSSRGYRGIVRAAVTDVQVISDGFLTCGGDGSAKLIQLGRFSTGNVIT